jgi:hypothetical protein
LTAARENRGDGTGRFAYHRLNGCDNISKHGLGRWSRAVRERVALHRTILAGFANSLNQIQVRITAKDEPSEALGLALSLLKQVV